MTEFVAYENEFEAFSINDGSKDYYFRLSKLIPELNVVQLKKLEQEKGGQKVIDLGVRTNTIDVHDFMAKVNQLNLNIELECVS